MTLQPPKKAPPVGRMTAEEAQAGLCETRSQLAAHQAMCTACQRARDAKKARTVAWASWVVCDDARALLQRRYQYEHRLYYLRQQAIRQAAKARGFTVGQFMRECREDYQRIVAELSA
jgi:tagatose-1,6-bisphosphate aldolase non-catalytic subunit AgaZ/GatZ